MRAIKPRASIESRILGVLERAGAACSFGQITFYTGWKTRTAALRAALEALIETGDVVRVPGRPSCRFPSDPPPEYTLPRA